MTDFLGNAFRRKSFLFTEIVICFIIIVAEAVNRLVSESGDLIFYGSRSKNLDNPKTRKLSIRLCRWESSARRRTSIRALLLFLSNWNLGLVSILGSLSAAELSTVE